MTSIGIDKILLTTKEFRVQNLSDQNIFGRKSNIPQGGGALPIHGDIQGNRVEANSFYHNGKYANIDISQKGLAITFNPSGALHPFNLTTTGGALDSHVNLVNNQLKDIGIITNTETLKLSRFDLARNEALEHPLTMYNEGLKYLKGKRSDSRSAPNGFYVGNKSHEAIFYDKQKQLKYKKEVIITPDNFMRLEARFRNTATVKRYTTIETLKDLQSIDEVDIDSMYKSYLQKVIFSRSRVGDQMMLDFGDEAKIFNAIKNTMPRGYFNYWLQLKSIDEVLNLFGSIQNLELFLHSVETNRMTVYRHIDKIKGLISTRGAMQKGKVVTPITLLNEIKHRFVA